MIEDIKEIKYRLDKLEDMMYNVLMSRGYLYGSVNEEDMNYIKDKMYKKMMKERKALEKKAR